MKNPQKQEEQKNIKIEPSLDQIRNFSIQLKLLGKYSFEPQDPRSLKDGMSDTHSSEIDIFCYQSITLFS